MSKRVLCLLGEGFEEIELATPIDILNRSGVEVVIAGVQAKVATGRSGLQVVADELLSEVETSEFDLLFIPGGPGVGGLREDGRPAQLAREFAQAGKPVAAICAAPLVLKDAGLLEGKNFTSFDGVREELGGGSFQRVVIDGDIITSRGAGTAMDFALALSSLLVGEEVAQGVAKEILL